MRQEPVSMAQWAQDQWTSMKEISARPFFYAFLLVLAFFLLEMVFFTPYFLINDDHWFLFIVKGVGFNLKPDEHVLTNNVILGLFFKTLYSWFPRPCWYTYYLLAVQFLSLWALLSSLLLRSRSPLTLFFFSVLFWALFPFYYLQLNYTVEALLAFQSALFLWASARETDPHRFHRSMLLMFPCLILSALTRWEAFLFAGVITFPFFLFLLWKRRPTSRDWKVALALGSIVAILGLIDHFYYEQNPTWNQFTHFYSPSSDLRDNKIPPPPPLIDELLGQVGWTRNDLRLFYNWYSMDQDRYNIDSIRKLSVHFSRYHVSGWRDFAYLFQADFVQSALLCFFLLLLLIPRDRLHPCWINALWILLCMLALCYYGRAPNRLIFPCFSYLAMIALYQVVPSGSRPAPSLIPKWTKPMLVLVALMIVPSFVQHVRYDRFLGAQNRLLEDSLDRLQPKEDQLYVIWDSTFPFEGLRALDDFESFRKFHIFTLAPFERAPFNRDMLDHFGVKDLFYDMVDRSDIFLMCKKEEGDLYRQYMREKHHMEVYAEKTFDCPFYRVFRIHSKPPGPKGWPPAVSIRYRP